MRKMNELLHLTNAAVQALDKHGSSHYKTAAVYKASSDDRLWNTTSKYELDWTKPLSDGDSVSMLHTADTRDSGLPATTSYARHALRNSQDTSLGSHSTTESEVLRSSTLVDDVRTNGTTQATPLETSIRSNSSHNSHISRGSTSFSIDRAVRVKVSSKSLKEIKSPDERSAFHEQTGEENSLGIGHNPRNEHHVSSKDDTISHQSANDKQLYDSEIRGHAEQLSIEDGSVPAPPIRVEKHLSVGDIDNAEFQDVQMGDHTGKCFYMSISGKYYIMFNEDFILALPAYVTVHMY